MERLKRLGLAELKLLAHPLRQRILLAFRFGGMGLSVQQLAHRLGLPHGKVYYHVQRLASAGLLQPAGERTINGIVERLYLPAAQGFVANEEELRGLPGYAAVSQAVVENTLAEVLAVFREFGQQQEEALRTHSQPPGLSAGFSHLWLTADEQERLVEQVETLLRPFEVEGEPDDDRGGRQSDTGDAGGHRGGRRSVQFVWLWFSGLRNLPDGPAKEGPGATRAVPRRGCSPKQG